MIHNRRRTTYPLIVFLSVLGIVQWACGLKSLAAPTEIPELSYTQAFETIIAEFTLEAPSTPEGATPSPEAALSSLTITPLAATITPLPEPTLTSTLTPTPLPSPTPIPAAGPGTLVIEDSFEDTSGWYTDAGEKFGFEYIQDGYRIYNNLKGAVIWSLHWSQYGDVRLEVDTQPLSGPASAAYGVTCRYVDKNNYYALVIGREGFFGIGKMKGGEYDYLVRGSDALAAIHLDGGINRVRADCVGSTLILYANQNKLAEVQDSEFPEGDIGLVVANISTESGGDVLFDNFEVYVP
jgi:hypothetical protein